MKNWGVIEEDRIKVLSLSGSSQAGIEEIQTVQELKIGPWGSFVRKVLKVMKEERIINLNSKACENISRKVGKYMERLR